MSNSFTPLASGTKKLIIAGAVSESIALAKSAERELEISNEGPNTVFVELGPSTIAAVAPVDAGAAGAYPILAGQSKVIRNLRGCAYAAAICNAGEAATVFFSSGDGE